MFHPLTSYLSPTCGSWCYPATCASDFLSFSSTAPLSPSLSCPHILLLISIHDHTTSNYFHALFGYFSHLRYPSNSFIPYSPLIHPNTLISATYCDFFTAVRFCPGSCSFIHILYYHYILIWLSFLPLAPPNFLTRHSIVRLPCFSTRCRTANIASAIPLPGIKPNCASLSLLSIILSQICKVYQCYPSAIPTILGVSLVFINWAAVVQSDYLSTPLIFSCSYKRTLCFRLITCQSLPLANTSSGIPSISDVSPFFIRGNVTLQ